MFQAQRLAFYSCISPVHVGAGPAIGAIDYPIQREVHTQHPLLPGSSLKGATRHRFARLWGDPAMVARVFGAERETGGPAGAIAFADAQLVAFPVRSLRRAYVYATSPAALARLKRMAGAAADWSVPAVPDDTALMASAGAASGGRLVLEAFDFEAQEDAALRRIGQWLGTHALPAGEGFAYFRDKLATDLVLLGDTELGHFVRHATVLESHLRCQDDSGGGGQLFHTENLPPETLLAGLVLASVERRLGQGCSATPPMDASSVLASVLDGPGGLAGGLLQVGGQASTGRGLVAVNAMEPA